MHTPLFPKHKKTEENKKIANNLDDKLINKILETNNQIRHKIIEVKKKNLFLKFHLFLLKDEDSLFKALSFAFFFTVDSSEKLKNLLCNKLKEMIVKNVVF